MSGLQGTAGLHRQMRTEELLKRAARDPVEVDKRPLHVIMNDHVPYERWEREKQIINRAGYRTWFELLRDRHDAKNRKD